MKVVKIPAFVLGDTVSASVASVAAATISSMGSLDGEVEAPGIKVVIVVKMAASILVDDPVTSTGAVWVA